jgi:protocatechuate 3,4-dioxygenase beta subunit
VPTETAGPYPADGSNGPDVLDDSGIVRHDIRRSLGSRRTLARGIPLRVNLTVTDAARGFAPMVGAAVYLWHCDRLGRYSMYSSGVQDENYLPRVVCRKVYGTSGYSGTQSNLARTSLATDLVFRDDRAIHQLATVTGNVSRGFVANLTIGV